LLTEWTPPVTPFDAISDCEVCEQDRAFLANSMPPDYSRGSESLTLVDLFAGCGGLTLGLAEAARRLGLATDVRLAVDDDPDAASVFEVNLPASDVRQQTVESLFDGELGEDATQTERELAERVGPLHLLVGGPPCQGHSNLNNHTRRDDPRNTLYARMARAAEVLRPKAILVENVPPVKNDTAGVLDTTIATLRAVGYECEDKVIDSSRLGVPQLRRRHILLAARKDCFDPLALLEKLDPPCSAHNRRTLRWAIGDLEEIEERTGLDVPSQVSKDNAERIQWLFDNDAWDLPNPHRPKCHRSDHSYRSMYGRLKWNEPAQTVTTGFGSMGQGRYVHPRQRRTLTPHEAARLQTFPDFFDFGVDRHRSSWARMIGNAVPPLLNVVIGTALLSLLDLPKAQSEDVDIAHRVTRHHQRPSPRRAGKAARSRA
jgi:DNA (cytosine-5)-methyltransferase 1